MLLFGSSWLVQVRNVKVQLGHAASLDAVCVMVCHTDRVLQWLSVFVSVLLLLLLSAVATCW
jgi:hypothetical protein